MKTKKLVKNIKEQRSKTSKDDVKKIIHDIIDMGDLDYIIALYLLNDDNIIGYEFAEDLAEIADEVLREIFYY